MQSAIGMDADLLYRMKNRQSGPILRQICASQDQACTIQQQPCTIQHKPAPTKSTSTLRPHNTIRAAWLHPSTGHPTLTYRNMRLENNYS
jgi:hypothetical protein